MSRGPMCVLIVMTLALGALSCAPPDQPVAAVQPAGYSPAQIARGKELVQFGSCGDCHTPWKFDPEAGVPVPDMSRYLSGHPEGAPDPQGHVGDTDMALIGPTGTSFALPFGTVYAVNLTPDEDTGIGSWTEKMFLDIFRTGSHLGGKGRPVMPPMPWYSVASLSDEDIVAIYAYLRSIPPVRNGVPTFNPPLPVQEALSKENGKILSDLDRAAGRKTP